MEEYRFFKGFHVLNLKGSDAEMGYQHGHLLAQAIQRGPVPYFRDYLPRMLATALGQAGGRTVANLLQASVGRQLLERFPPHLRSHLEGLAAGSGLALNDVMNAFVLPDLFLWLVSLSNRVRRPGPAPLLPPLGCSSALVQAEASTAGLLHGRNLDYMGVGYWDSEQAILFYQPDQGQSYVSISAAGIPFGGITAMNSAGLTLAVHQHLSCLNVKRGGVPIGIAGDAVMRQAESLADAVKILDAHPPTACWTYLIASGPEKAVLCYETGGAATRWKIHKEAVFGYTNFYKDPSLAAAETHFYPSQWRSNLGRYQSICRGLAADQLPLSPASIRRILGHTDSDCRLARPLAMLYTVSSAVMAPDQGLVWVAAGPTPVSQREFWAFDLRTRAPREDLAPLSGALSDPQADMAFQAYREAYKAWFEQHDSHRALNCLETACILQPGQALYAYMAGLLALDQRLPDQAIHWLNKALAQGHTDPERVASFYLWRARAYDLAGLRACAREDYQAACAGVADASVLRSARAGLSRTWQWRRLALEFNYAEAL